jgi:hypothetical protein
MRDFIVVLPAFTVSELSAAAVRAGGRLDQAGARAAALVRVAVWVAPSAASFAVSCLVSSAWCRRMAAMMQTEALQLTYQALWLWLWLVLVLVLVLSAPPVSVAALFGG